MNAGQLLGIACDHLDEDPVSPTYWTQAEILHALDEAQKLFVLLTLCLETSKPLPLQAAKAWYRIRGYRSDFLLPLKVVANGVRLRPARIAELDALDQAWQAKLSPGGPKRYTQAGLSLFAVTPQPAAPGLVATITYARTPNTIAGPGDVPEIPVHYHEALVDGAFPHLAAKAGGSLMTAAIESFQKFIEAATKLGSYIRQRSLASRYDRLPPEIARMDQSRILRALTQPTRVKK